MNVPWLQCTPASGPTADTPQKAVLECVGERLEAKLHRGAVVFRTDLGLNCAIMADVRVCPDDPPRNSGAKPGRQTE